MTSNPLKDVPAKNIRAPNRERVLEDLLRAYPIVTREEALAMLKEAGL